jgi:hypothetical protein
VTTQSHAGRFGSTLASRRVGQPGSVAADPARVGQQPGGRQRRGPRTRFLALLGGEVAWAHHKTPLLFDGEPSVRIEARQAASAWLARTARPSDVLFGYDPLYLGAWERNGALTETVVPRADPKLALSVLRDAPKPLGRGVWVFDASDTNNFSPKLTIPLRMPRPASAFEARVWGPFLVIRSLEPTRTVRRYLAESKAVELAGQSIYIGDADVNLDTVTRALRRLDRGQ